MAELYDLIIIGGGPGGYNAAERAGEAGLKTLLFEERALGGVCLNEGCIPTKTLLYSAKIFDYAKHSKEYGVTFGDAKIDHGFVINRKNGVVKMLVSGVGAKMKKAGIKVVTERAVVTGRTTEGFEITAKGEKYTAKQLLIAAGSVPAMPPIPGLFDSVKSGFALTNREILDLTEAPKKLIVIGGGVIGLEMASYFKSIGTEVVVIEMLDKIAGPTDAEISKLLLKNYTAKGIDFKLSAKVVSVGKDSVTFEKDGKTVEEKADKCLVSIGRRAMTKEMGLESIGVELDRGAVKTDEYGKTNVPGVYACGDVNGKSMLAHTAYREGEVCINNILGKKDRINYNAIPSVIYTNPEVASVGYSLEAAKAAGIDAEEHKLTLNYSGRYIAENEKGEGILKLVVDKAHKTVVGVHTIGGYASESIYGAAIMIEKEMRIDDIKKVVFPHPTVCEVLREALYEVK
jgi:dihydrolipoamide dehydrogenase